jgi:hypothetical protein
MAGESILDSTKKALGIAPDYDVFDVDILMHINTVFAVLSQLGIGPEDGFLIEDAEAVWEDFLGTDKQLNSVRTYVFLRVKILFDPPGNSFVMNPSYDAEDIVIDFALDGNQSKTVHGGYYDVVIADANDPNARGLVILSGRLQVDQLVTEVTYA